MPTNTYLNPASLAPQLGGQPRGATAGMLSYEREQDYRTALQNQFLLQDIANREANIGLYNTMQDVPVKDMERGNKLLDLGAKRPYIEALARSNAETTLHSNAYKRDVTEGPEARAAAIKESLDKLSKIEFEQIKRESGLINTLLPQAMAMGEEEGARWIQQQMERYAKAGYNVPAWLANPKNWKKAFDASVELDREFQRRMKEEKYKQEQQNWRTDRSAKATENAAKSRGAGGGGGGTKEPPTPFREFNQRLRALDSMPENTPQYEEGLALANRAFNTLWKTTLEEKTLDLLEEKKQYRMSTPAEKQERFEAEREAVRRQLMGEKHYKNFLKMKPTSIPQAGGGPATGVKPSEKKDLSGYFNKK